MESLKSAAPRLQPSAWPSAALPWLILLAAATIGVERIDLLFWSAPFVLTPTLLFLGCLALAVLVLWVRHEIRIQWTVGFIFVIAFCALAVLTSLINGASLISVGRAAMLTLTAAGMWLLIAAAIHLGRPDLVRRGAAVSLGIYAAFAVAQQIVWFTSAREADLYWGPIHFNVPQLGAEMARIGGSTIDPNRSCLTLACITVLMVVKLPNAPAPRRWFQVGIVSLTSVLALLTISRSGLLLYACVVGGSWLIPFMGEFTRRTRWRILAGAGVALVLAAAVALIGFSRQITYLIETRLQVDPGSSASEHVVLLGEAVDAIVADPLILLRGAGFGNAYTLLGDVPAMAEAGKYANFHSGYATALVEMGVLGLALVVALMGRPLFSRWYGIAAGLLIFSTFYQAAADASYWLLLAIAWLTTKQAMEHRRIILPGAKAVPEKSTA